MNIPSVEPYVGRSSKSLLIIQTYRKWMLARGHLAFCEITFLTNKRTL